MALQFGGTKIGGMQYNGVTIGEAMYNGQIVWASGFALPKSRPDYWYSLENGGHSYNRGTRDIPLGFESGAFSNRSEHVWVAGAKSRINMDEPWNGVFTVAAWFQQTGSFDKDNYLFSRGQGTTGAELEVVKSATDNRIAVRIRSSSQSDWVYTPTGSVSPSEWFHLAVTSEVVSGRNYHRYYINGVEVYSFHWSSSHTPLAFAASDWMSVANMSSTQTSENAPFNGNMDDVAVWTRTLSASEVGRIYSQGRIPSGELAPPPRYTGSYSGGQAILAQNAETTMLSHTVTRAGTATITGGLAWGTQDFGSTYTLRVRVNGVERASYNVIQRNQSASTGVLALAAGDVVTVTATTNSEKVSYRSVTSSTLTFA